MSAKNEPDMERHSTEWPAVSRQSKALEEVDKLLKSVEPAGEKLKNIVKDHSEACEEIKTKLEGHKTGR
jgi:hypothetical protein